MHKNQQRDLCMELIQVIYPGHSPLKHANLDV